MIDAHFRFPRPEQPDFHPLAIIFGDYAGMQRKWYKDNIEPINKLEDEILFLLTKLEMMGYNVYAWIDEEDKYKLWITLSYNGVAYKQFFFFQSLIHYGVDLIKFELKKAIRTD